MDSNVKANGENAMLNQMTFQDFAKLVLKLKNIKNQVLRKILTLISCSIVKDLVNKKN